VSHRSRVQLHQIIIKRICHREVYVSLLTLFAERFETVTSSVRGHGIRTKCHTRYCCFRKVFTYTRWYLLWTSVTVEHEIFPTKSSSWKKEQQRAEPNSLVYISNITPEEINRKIRGFQCAQLFHSNFTYFS